MGSAVRGELRPESDVDIIAEFKPEGRVRGGLLEFESLVDELAALAGRKVDLVTKRGLKLWVTDPYPNLRQGELETQPREYKPGHRK